MRTITFKLHTNTTTTTESVYGQAFAQDDNATTLVFDFTDEDCATWDKWLDLSMSDFTKDTQNLGTGAIVSFVLKPEHTKRGDLRINPYAKSGTSRVGYPIQVLKVERQLNNSVVDASAQQSMIDYFDVALAVKAVTVETLAEGSQATASVTKASDGLTFAYGIPKGDTGAKGDAFVYEDFTTEQLDAIKAPLTEVAQAVTTAESSRVGAENTRVSNENARLVFQTYNALTAYVPGNKVAYNGSSYVCILASTGNLPTNTTYWLMIAQAGSVSEAQLATKADKLMATNIPTNGDFSNGTTGWNAIANVTQIVESGVCRFTATAQYGGVRRTFTPILGHIYYVAARFQSVSSFVRLYHSGLSAEYKVSLGTGSYEIVSNVLAATSASAQSWGVRDFRASGWTEVLFDWFMVIDLTVTFGAGKEPTLAQFEAKLALLYPSLYFDGSIEFATIRSLYNDKEDKTSVEKALVIGSKNIFNKANIISSKEVYTDGSFQNESNSKITDFIDISNHFGSIYISGLTVYAAGYNRYLWFYDASKVKIGSLITIDKSLTEYGLYVPASARYVAFSICQRKTSLEVIDLNSIQVEYGKSKTAYSNYELYASAIGSNKLYIDQTSNIQSYGKNMLIFGDSVSETATISEDGATYTEGTRMNWPINAKSNLKLGSVLNYARSGATFKDQNIVGDVRKSLSQQITLAINNGRPGDIVVVAIGTNDGVDSLGSYATAMSKTTLESLDRSNIYEAMRWGLWKIRIEYPNALCFISTPIQRASGDQPADLLTAIKAMGARYNFIVVNQHDESQIVRDFETVGSAGRYLSDGLHPNTLGQERMSDLFCSTIKRYLNK